MSKSPGMQYDQSILISKIENYLLEKGFTNFSNDLEVVYKYPGYLVAYLPEFESGVLGCGETIDGAFNDFTENCQEIHYENFSQHSTIEYQNIAG